MLEAENNSRHNNLNQRSNHSKVPASLHYGVTNG